MSNTRLLTIPGAERPTDLPEPTATISLREYEWLRAELADHARMVLVARVERTKLARRVLAARSLEDLVELQVSLGPTSVTSALPAGPLDT